MSTLNPPLNEMTPAQQAAVAVHRAAYTRWWVELMKWRCEVREQRLDPHDALYHQRLAESLAAQGGVKAARRSLAGEGLAYLPLEQQLSRDLLLPSEERLYIRELLARARECGARLKVDPVLIF